MNTVTCSPTSKFSPLAGADGPSLPGFTAAISGSTGPNPGARSAIGMTSVLPTGERAAIAEALTRAVLIPKIGAKNKGTSFPVSSLRDTNTRTAFASFRYVVSVKVRVSKSQIPISTFDSGRIRLNALLAEEFAKACPLAADAAISL